MRRRVPAPHPLPLDLDRIPTEPGVYQFLDADGDVLYVGKALDLRARLASYRPGQVEPRKEGLLQFATSVEVILTRTEREALLLEATLVKRLKPRYNVRLTDDKRYPYLAITKETWPRILLTRDPAGKNATYFGPFPDGLGARKAFEVVRQVFKLRNCRELVPGGCLAYQMRLCWAPCITDRETRRRAVNDPALADVDVEEAYEDAARAARRFLKGDDAEVVDRLTARMETAAEAHAYESAARYRDQLQAVRGVLERQSVFSGKLEDKDVFVLSREGGAAVGVLTLVREGTVAAQEHFTFARLPDEATDDELLGQFIRRYYELGPTPPGEVVVARELDDAAVLEEWLREVRGGACRLRVPRRGDLVGVLRLGERNARYHLEQGRLKRGDADRVAELADLATRLGLEEPPRRIECVDVSHLGGRDVVASLVVLEQGAPKRSAYRRFKVLTDANDDVAAIREVVERRLKRDDWPLPDLLLIDGGRTQLAAAAAARTAAGRLDVPLAGLAKREEEVWHLGPHEVPVKAGVPRSAPGLMPLMRARDEAHRFALDHQKRRRRKRLTEGGLDSVPGIGAARKRALLAHFGSPEKVARATVEDLARVPGIGPEVARRIHAALGLSGDGA